MHEYSELFSLLYTSYARNVINVQDKCFLKRNSFLYKQKINALMSQCNPCIYCTPALIDKNTLLHCKYTITFLDMHTLMFVYLTNTILMRKVVKTSKQNNVIVILFIIINALLSELFFNVITVLQVPLLSLKTPCVFSLST